MKTLRALALAFRRGWQGNVLFLAFVAAVYLYVPFTAEMSPIMAPGVTHSVRGSHE